MRRPARLPRVSMLLVFVLSLVAMPGGALAAPGGNAPLTGPKAGDAVQIVLDYIRAQRADLGLVARDVADIVVTDSYVSAQTSVTHVYLRQRHAGIEVVEGNANASVARDGSILSLNQSFVKNLQKAVRAGGPGRSAEASVKSAATQLGWRAPAKLAVKENRGGKDAAVVFAPNGISLEPISAKLVYQAVGDRLNLAWQLEIYEPDGSGWWNLRVDANSGDILARDDYFSHADDEYNVVARPGGNPVDDPRTMVANPAANGSPFGWHDTNGAAGAEFTTTQGNNVHAYADRNADNVPDAGSSPDGGTGLVFDFDLDLELPPIDYQPAAVTNLFYWNNIVHDVLYAHGFDERAGNFQVNNYGNRGKAGDDVRAEAQDGSGRNNANFGTPPDGMRPRMQMFEWRDSAPNPLEVEGVGTVSGPMAGFGDSLATTGPISGLLMVVNDGVGVTSDGCEPFTLPGEPGTVIPLIDRGTCTFVVKVKNAEVAGAQAAVVANNIPGPATGMGGADPTITIPSIMISLDDATLVKPALPANATLSPNPDLEPDRDSDFDSGVIVHEYGHGVSNRLTGGPGNTGCLQNEEQMGEGWSDFLALVLTARAGDEDISRGIGTYVVFEGPDGPGIRPTPYSRDTTVNSSTYQTVITSAGTTLSIPHGVGYVWATMLWEMYGSLVDQNGFNPNIYADWTTGGNNLALQLVLDGMKFQPCSPGFVQGRDGILDADLALTGGENQCLIWEAFAKRGLGFSAEQRSSKKANDGTAAFDLPAECAGASGLVVPLVLALAAKGALRLEAPRRPRGRRTRRDARS